MAARMIRFGESPEDQAGALEVVRAVRDGYLDRLAAKPLYVEQDGTPVYRILMGGLRWRKYDDSSYAALDGTRTWHATRGGRLWFASLFIGGNREVVGEFRTMGDARNACEHLARRMPWAEGAPW